MKILLISFIFIQPFAFSQTIEKRTDEFYLISEDCNSLKKSVTDLETWTKSTGETCNLSSLENRSNGSCSVKISNCLPQHVKTYYNATPQVHGPNCFNLSMVMSGILPNLRYSTGEEMSFFMNPPLCRALQINEKRKPGDIGSIRELNRNDYHGFIHVSENLVYSKNGYRMQAPYKLQSYDSMMSTMFKDSEEARLLKHKLKKECRGAQSIYDLSCKAHVEYFRCKSMDEYLKENKDNISNEVADKVSVLDQIECNVSSQLFDLDLADTAFELAYKVSEVLFMYLSFELEKLDKLTEQERFVLGSLKIRLEALKSTIDKADYQEPLSHESQSKVSFLREMVRQSIQRLDTKIQKK